MLEVEKFYPTRAPEIPRCAGPDDSSEAVALAIAPPVLSGSEGSRDSCPERAKRIEGSVASSYAPKATA